MTESPDDERPDAALEEQYEPGELYADSDIASVVPHEDRRERPSGPSSHTGQRPGPLNPGEAGPDTPSGFGSFERPGRDGNWTDDELED